MSAPCKRWGHGIVLYENQMYLFGGSGNNSNPKSWEAIYILNCDTFEWERICPSDPFKGNIPETRDSHSATKIGNNMYIFGGSNGNFPFNDIFAFNFTFRSWNKVNATGDIPLPREGHSAGVLNDRYIFIYGGWNGKMIYNNYYLFDTITNIWRKVEPEDPNQEPLIRESHSCSVIKDHFYIFGGQGVNVKKKENYLNDFYRGKLNFHKNMEKITCKWEKILAKNNASPPHRTSHSSCSYKDRYIFIIGGEGYCVDNQDLKQWEHEKKEIYLEKDFDDEKTPPCFPKNDVWIYDTEQNFWGLLEAKNSELFLPRFTHSCSVYKDQFIIFGGLKDYKNSIDDLVVLIIDDEDFKIENNKKDIDLCNSCRRIFMVENETKTSKNSLGFSNEDIMLEGSKSGNFLDETKLSQYEKLKNLSLTKHSKQAEITSQNFQTIAPSISMRSVSKFAGIIDWPFSAIGLLVDNAKYKKANSLKITFGHTKSQNKAFMNFTDDGEVWTMREISDVCLKMKLDLNHLTDYEQKDQEDRDKSRYEIAKSMYSINLKLGGFRLGDTVIYGSKTDTSIIICFMTSKNPSSSSSSLEDTEVILASWGLKTDLTKNNEKRKKIIELLSSYLSEQELSEMIGNNTILIMDLKKVLGMNELTFSLKPEKNDIFYKPHKLIGKKMSFSYKEYVDFSLRKYLEYFYLVPENSLLKVFLNQHEVKKINLFQEIQSDLLFSSIPLTPDILSCISQGKIFVKLLIKETVSLKVETYSKTENSLKNEEICAETNNQESSNKKDGKKNKEKENLPQGILLYSEGRLFARIENENFGDLLFFNRRFEKRKKNKSNSEMFDFSGALELKGFLETNIVKTVLCIF